MQITEWEAFKLETATSAPQDQEIDEKEDKAWNNSEDALDIRHTFFNDQFVVRRSPICVRRLITRCAGSSQAFPDPQSKALDTRCVWDCNSIACRAHHMLWGNGQLDRLKDLSQVHLYFSQ